MATNFLIWGTYEFIHDYLLERKKNYAMIQASLTGSCYYYSSIRLGKNVYLNICRHLDSVIRYCIGCCAALGLICKCVSCIDK